MSILGLGTRSEFLRGRVSCRRQRFGECQVLGEVGYRINYCTIALDEATKPTTDG
jgi:hypothetical protein